MKLHTVAIVLLLCIAILVTANSIFITRTVDTYTAQIRALTEEGDVQALHADIARLRADYDAFEAFWSLSVSHDDLMNIRTAFADLEGAAKANDTISFIQAKSRLIDALMHLRRLSALNFYSVF